MADSAFGETIPRRIDGVLEAALPDELLLHVPGDSTASVLNATARAVWELCDGRRSVEAIARELAQRFDAAPGDILTSVRDVVRDLARLQLVVLPVARDSRPDGA
jgi:hypothetical protein